jgi:RNA polymerase sigma-70 factor, ECF subfamily
LSQNPYLACLSIKQQSDKYLKKFDSLYQLHYPTIHRLVAGMVSDTDQIADLVQEVFVKLYLQLQTGVEVEYPRTWLYRVATNDCLNFLSRTKKDFRLDEIQDLSIETDESVENELDTADTRQQLQLAMDQLKPADKALLVLYSEGLSYKEMAEITGMPFNSVGKSLSRALNKLKLILNNKHHEMSY